MVRFRCGIQVSFEIDRLDPANFRLLSFTAHAGPLYLHFNTIYGISVYADGVRWLLKIPVDFKAQVPGSVTFAFDVCKHTCRVSSLQYSTGTVTEHIVLAHRSIDLSLFAGGWGYKASFHAWFHHAPARAPDLEWRITSSVE